MGVAAQFQSNGVGKDDQKNLMYNFLLSLFRRYAQRLVALNMLPPHVKSPNSNNGTSRLSFAAILK